MSQSISSIELLGDVDNPYIHVVFCLPWQQEDIDELSAHVISLFDDAAMIDHAQGADIETYHIRAFDTELLLNFEVYSESCWVEVVNNQDVTSIVKISEKIKSKISEK